MSLLAPTTPVPSLIPGGGLLPIPTPAPLQNVSQHLVALLLPCLFVRRVRKPECVCACACVVFCLTPADEPPLSESDVSWPGPHSIPAPPHG